MTDRLQKIMFFCLVVGVAGDMASAEAPLPARFIAIRQKACQPVQADYDQIVANVSKQPSLEIFHRRLLWLDESAGATLHAMAIHRNAYLGQSLAVIGDEQQGSADPEKSKLVPAMEIFCQQKAKGMGLNMLSEVDDDKAVLDAYWKAYCRGTQNALGAYGKSIVPKDPAEAAEITRLAAIPLYLTVKDDDAVVAVTALPEWMKTPSQLSILEEFSLHAGRPFLAHALVTQTPVTTRPEKGDEYTKYLQTAANHMLRSRDYATGAELLKTSLERMKASNDTTAWQETALHLGEVLSDADKSSDAILIIDQVMKSSAPPEVYARASLLHLRCLVKTQEFDRAVKDATEYVGDTRCESLLPEIIYVGWVASRQANASGPASETEWRTKFLQKFPDHPLGANMYFATAMQSLASSDYSGADRILAFIESHYPESSLISKVQEIRKKLAAASSDHAN